MIGRRRPRPSTSRRPGVFVPAEGRRPRPPPHRPPSLPPLSSPGQMEKVKSGKANWDKVAHSVYLDVCIEEVRANNRPDAFLSPLGYENLTRKFNERTKRNYSRMQLKNRWDACRKEYSIWKTLLQKASGLGRDPFTNTIDASEEWWALELKACPEAAKFWIAPLAEEDKMTEVFDACCVTNEHARVPTPTSQVGPSQVDLLDDDSSYEGVDAQVTPLSTHGKGGKKRACPYPPNPKVNEKMASESAKTEAFVRMVDMFQRRKQMRMTSESAKNEASVTSQMTVDPARQEIKDMMAMVITDGGVPGGDEHFYASQLFLEKEYRDVWSSFEDLESSVRLGWLRRTWDLYMLKKK